ncbi:hypothetical protein PoB_006257700 [Plakobranchus ocellatus]|uniref:Uncharacterized protein n=1 Tax=Plakobranchus ocellatus TaxID=259542 RepID=A0AAV4CVZ0_9GAST|nr:hypothetical protein PoB_006257700 [Plakobranchus ocellatus]
MEEAFGSVTPLALQTTGLRNMIINHLMLNDHPIIKRLARPNSKCDLLFYVTNLFTNIELHHHIKIKNCELTIANTGIKHFITIRQLPSNTSRPGSYVLLLLKAVHMRAWGVLR